jgi:hypothetical protein
LQSHRVTQEGIALAQHFGARGRIFELVIQTGPRHELVRHGNRR